MPFENTAFQIRIWLFAVVAELEPHSFWAPWMDIGAPSPSTSPSPLTALAAANTTNSNDEDDNGALLAVWYPGMDLGAPAPKDLWKPRTFIIEPDVPGTVWVAAEGTFFLVRVRVPFPPPGMISSVWKWLEEVEPMEEERLGSRDWVDAIR